MENLVLFKVHMPESVDEPLLKVLHSGFIGQGVKVDEFEEKLGNYFGNNKVLTLNSGTSGLHLALRLANVGIGDEVITTPMTCTATNMPIMATGAKIIWADINPITGLIDPEDIERKITNKTKAIVMVHFGGIPCDIDAINKIAKKHNIKTIEDAAHAIGSEYDGKKIGNHSDFVMFSLQAIKHFTTIDGGLLFCKNNKDYERGKLLRWYGIDRDAKRKEFRCEENILEYGYKYHMNDICATVGIEQLKYIDGIVERHMSNKNYYDKELQNIKGVAVIKKPAIAKSSSWLYTIHIEKRDQFSSWMTKQNIMTSRVHERNDKHTAFKEYQINLPNTDIFSLTQISIPVGWWITDDNRSYIVDKIKEFSAKHL
ncbi:MAG: pyridoxal-5'-phosphate-dependent protein [Gammaproteobacteria bacterium]|nr:MAG: pyridoxal-5'-phosphate-dependent protein [Gammaproteobacteria bacterium]